ncbi:Uncharacterised protein [uncultured archaeon]|nr:Uncharacterised protein [uncultured archaeon]
MVATNERKPQITNIYEEQTTLKAFSDSLSSAVRDGKINDAASLVEDALNGRLRIQRSLDSVVSGIDASPLISGLAQQKRSQPRKRIRIVLPEGNVEAVTSASEPTIVPHDQDEIGIVVQHITNVDVTIIKPHAGKASAQAKFEAPKDAGKIPGQTIIDFIR